MEFPPIAIVGRGCVLPGALSPRALWDLVADGGCALGPAAEGRWRVPVEAVVPRYAPHSVGGYVTGFNQRVEMMAPGVSGVAADFGAAARGLSAAADVGVEAALAFGTAGPGLSAAADVDVEAAFAFDTAARWAVEAARQALGEAGASGSGSVPGGARAGIVLGWLALPDEWMTYHVEEAWRTGLPLSDPARRRRQVSPAGLCARILGFGGGALALDAACASSLYAMKLACDRLHDGSADLMLAGGVSAADPLLLQTGFAALSALSRSGSYRPLQQSADGLVAAEGAALVALMRPQDAAARGIPVLGLIRGIGVGNDGRGEGLLVPSVDGQVRAMRAAYAAAGVASESVTLLECHATGTRRGDAAEVASSARVFAGAPDLVVGAVKANVGHAMTAAGAVGVLKVLGAIEHKVRPLMPAFDDPMEALRSTPLRVLRANEPWQGPRRAAVSAFGFGGNNAHIIIDAPDLAPEPASVAGRRMLPSAQTARVQVAVVGVGVQTGGVGSTGEFTDALLAGRSTAGLCESVGVRLDGLRVPPADLAAALARQVLILETAREAAAGVTLPPEGTRVLIGTDCDAEIVRHTARLRAGGGESAALSSAQVVGFLANMTANRISSQLGLMGASFAVAAEAAEDVRRAQDGRSTQDDATGPDILAMAVRAIGCGEAGAALVGAVDVCCPSLGDALEDAAVVLVLKRLDHARRDGDRVMSILPSRAAEAAGSRVGARPEAAGSTAGALLGVASGVLAEFYRARLRRGDAARPWLVRSAADVAGEGWLGQDVPRWHVFSGRDRAEVLAALGAGRESREGGPARLVIVEAADDVSARRAGQARRWLLGEVPKPRWAAYRDGPLAGQVAFVYPGGAAAYVGMGAQLALVFPDLIADLVRRCPQLPEVAGWVHDGGPRPGDTIGCVWGAAMFAHLHTAITRDVLGLAPNAALGYSSGESTALTALGAWQDLDGLVSDLRASPLFSRELAGSYDAVRRVWARAGLSGLGDGSGRLWRTYLATLPAEVVRQAAAEEPLVYPMAVNSPYSCTFGGDPAACSRVARRVGADHVMTLDYDLAIHAPVVAEVREQWFDLHRRPTSPVPGVGFYGCAAAEMYELDDVSAAAANTAQAVAMFDFRATVERAWADGVRTFVEHGPAGGCTEWIGQTLGEREHLAVSLDDRGGVSDVDNLAHAVAALIAAGVEVDDARLTERLLGARGSRRTANGDTGSARRMLVVPGHPTQDAGKAGERSEERLGAGEEPAPVRESVLGADAVLVGVAVPGAEPAPVRESAPGAEPALVREPTPSVESGALAVGGGDALGAHHAMVAGRHLDFIRLLADGHEAYLAQSARLNGLILGDARGSAPSPGAGPLFDRAELEYLAVGPVSALFGPAFSAQDGYARQTRMPGPPMLLADRVLGIDAEPASMGTGSIRTQTDVRADSWYLDPCGRMPAGLMVEAGQADLLLISWLGADLLNRGERVYRLLGCEITYHGSPPHPGETLTFDISIDEHAEQGGVRLFSFQYRCVVDGTPRLTVRRGQAGFFTDAELADTRGVVWNPPPINATSRPMRRFGPDQVRAFAQGRPAECFGPDVLDAASVAALGAQVRTPRPAQAAMLLFDEVDAHDPAGGYLRASLSIRPESWFFEGHFVGDPCMPGTLMLEGAFQLLAFHLTAAGATTRRDGWRFEPVPEQTCRIFCRAQVTPSNRSLSYEVFIRELMTGDDGSRPTVVADVLCSVDGVKAFLAEGLAVRLVPDWPLDQWRWLGGLAGHVEPKPAVFGLESLLACAWGRPSEMMGAVLAPMDDGRRVARLPGPPYHFMSRVVELGERSLVAEYDLRDDAWFWDESGGRGVMPLCVLVEAALQPCGWLALYTGEVAAAEVELLFRNLGGQGTFDNVARGTRVLRTQVRLLEISRTGAMIIDAFAVRVWADETLVADLRSDFGFFPPAAFAEQPGLPGPGWRARAEAEAEAGAEARPSARSTPTHPNRKTAPMLSLIDRVTGFWPAEGRIRGEKDVAATDWYFRSHFFQDPVQPGSLGIEAMLQLVQCFLVRSGLTAPDAVFEPWLDARTVTWKYRGQVVPVDPVSVIEVEVTESGPGYAVAQAWLSVGGRTIYHATGLGVRIVGDAGAGGAGEYEELLDPAVETWVADHRPTWTVPALPMMSVVDRLARIAGPGVAGLRDVRLSRWIVLDRPVRLRGRASVSLAGGARVELEHDGVVVASASSVEGPFEHPAPAPLLDAVEAELPYARGGVFHGPAFHYLTRWEIGSNGARGSLDSARGTVPRGRLHQGLLDATLHVIPHDSLWRWSEDIRPGYVGYPYRLPWIDFLSSLPDSGVVQVEARFAGFDSGVEILPVFDVQVFVAGDLALAYRLVEVLVPLGPLAGLEAPERAVFLRDRAYVPGAGLAATSADGVTRLRAEDLDVLEWFPGTVAHLYGLGPSGEATGADRLAQVAVRDHVGRRAGVHPSAVVPAGDLCSATVLGRPGEVYRVMTQRADREITVRDVR